MNTKYGQSCLVKTLLSKPQKVIDQTHFLELLAKKVLLAGYDLRGLDLSDIEIQNVSLAGLDLRGVIFNNCSFFAVDFSDSDIREVEFVNTTHVDVLFNGAYLQGSDFTNSTHVQTSFMRACLNKAVLKGSWMCDVSFESADGAADFEGSVLLEAVFWDAKLSGGNFNHVDMPDAQAAGADFSASSMLSCNMTGINLEDADMTGVDMCRSNISYGWLVNTSMSGSCTMNMVADEVCFDGAKINNTKIIDIARDKRSFDACGLVTLK